MPKLSKPVRDTGVYCIKNKINNKVYVGSSSVSLFIRLRVHKGDLRRNKHPNRHLQSAWNKYGEKAFEFGVILRCRPENCIVFEQHYIDKLKACNDGFGYNIRLKADSNLGIKLSGKALENVRCNHSTPEYKLKMREAAKKRFEDPGLRKLYSKIMKERWEDQEFRDKVTAKHRKNMKDPEIRKKISEANKGKKMSVLTRLRMSNAKRNISDETRAKMSEAAKNRSKNRDTIN